MVFAPTPESIECGGVKLDGESKYQNLKKAESQNDDSQNVESQNIKT